MARWIVRFGSREARASIERDPDLPAVLDETCDDFDNFTLIGKDALRLNDDDLIAAFGKQTVEAGEAPNKFISNLPPRCRVATLVLDYFQRIPSLQSATVMVQSEVADRMEAVVGTKDYAAYSVKLQFIAALSLPVRAGHSSRRA